MKYFKPALIILIALLAISLLIIGAIATVTFSTNGGGFSGSEWLVGLGFGAMLTAIVCPILIALMLISAWLKSRSKLNTQ
ncbi:hypothetical protein [Brevibacterium sp. CFH 10365]|uniref:hypothetical protein n=1 Tax=Brevibacterium sp. CFH 10365 TaxID=2585207 RepID=UPI00126632F6|nr:hypothetical protein [Brevibacterium sp. CFH 10365]